MLKEGQKVVVKIVELRHYGMNNVARNMTAGNSLIVGQEYIAEWLTPSELDDEGHIGCFVVRDWCLHINDVELIEIIKE
jgi:hypothetical protein